MRTQSFFCQIAAVLSLVSILLYIIIPSSQFTVILILVTFWVWLLFFESIFPGGEWVEAI